MKLLSIVLDRLEASNLAKKLATHKCVSQVFCLDLAQAKAWDNKELKSQEALLVIIGKFKKIKVILDKENPNDIVFKRF